MRNLHAAIVHLQNCGSLYNTYQLEFPLDFTGSCSITLLANTACNSGTTHALLCFRGIFNQYIFKNELRSKSNQFTLHSYREKALRFGERVPPTRALPISEPLACYWSAFAAETRGKNAPHEKQWHSLARAALEPFIVRATAVSWAGHSHRQVPLSTGSARPHSVAELYMSWSAASRSCSLYVYIES